MLFRRKSAVSVGTTGLPSSSTTDVRSCPTLKKALHKISALVKPEILDLGPMCGATAVFLANRGARVSVEEFIPPAQIPKRAAGDESSPPPIEPFTIDQPSDGFDLVLAWEAIDFTPPERLQEVTAELRRLVRGNGLLFLLSRNTTGARKSIQDLPGRFRVDAVDRVTREPVTSGAAMRWVHPTREIERMLNPLAVQGIHLQRDQTREILALRKPSQ